MALNVVIAQVLLTLLVGIWIGARFKDSPFVKFFDRNDWFIGIFLILVGYTGFSLNTVNYIKTINLVLMVIGLILISFSFIDVARSRR